MAEVKKKKKPKKQVKVMDNTMNEQSGSLKKERRTGKAGGGKKEERFKTPQPLTYRYCGERRRRGFSTTLLYVSVISHFWVKKGSLVFLLLRQEIYKWIHWQIQSNHSSERMCSGSLCEYFAQSQSGIQKYCSLVVRVLK